MEFDRKKAATIIISKMGVKPEIEEESMEGSEEKSEASLKDEALKDCCDQMLVCIEKKDSEGLKECFKSLFEMFED